MPKFKKGRRKTGGRVKGTPNKIAANMAQAVWMAFEDAGGVEKLTKWAKRSPAKFYPIAAKLIPHQIVGDPDKPVGIKVTFGGRYKPPEAQP